MNPRNFLLFAFCSLLIFVFSGFANAQENSVIKQEETVIEQKEPVIEQEGLTVEPSDLKAEVPDLCYQCHVKLKKSLLLSNVHFPFKDGKCISCHNIHASNMKKLIRDDINSLCLSCHDAIQRKMEEGYVHYALKRGVCTDCHYAHSGDYKYLLVRSQKDICWDCHKSIKEQLKQSILHKPFAEGKCSSCHEPHASSQENQLKEVPNKICQNCHLPECKVGDVSIKSITANMDCTSCHGGHASNTSGLLGPYGHISFLTKKCEQCHNPILPNTEITTKIQGSNLCFRCHKKDSSKYKENDFHGRDENGGCGMCHSYHASKRKNLTIKESILCFKCHEKTERSTILMEKALRSIRCVPVKDRKCFECHIPLHSQNQLYLKAGSIESCVRCHTQEHKITHPLGKDAIDPRNGQPITCITCHSMHSSKAKFMLIYDRKRQLCIQCHKK